MKKKVYISPITEILNLCTMNAVMDSPIYGPGSTPKTLAPGYPIYS